MAPPLPNSAHETSSYLRNLAVPRVFKRPSYVTRWRRTGWLGWLGRRDSNLCILESEFAKTLSSGGAGLELAHLELMARSIDA